MSKPKNRIPLACLRAFDEGANVKQRIKTAFAGGVLALALFGAAMADTLGDGLAAYQKHDYAAAMEIGIRWRIKGKPMPGPTLASCTRKAKGCLRTMGRR